MKKILLAALLCFFAISCSDSSTEPQPFPVGNLTSEQILSALAGEWTIYGYYDSLPPTNVGWLTRKEAPIKRYDSGTWFYFLGRPCEIKAPYESFDFRVTEFNELNGKPKNYTYGRFVTRDEIKLWASEKGKPKTWLFRR